MGWFIVAIVLALVALVVLLFDRARRRSDSRGNRIATTIGVGLLVVGGVIGIADSFTIVPARNVGIVNTFGHADETLSNGFHWVAPWSAVEKIDATVQNINLSSDTHDCITVRLANQTTACVDTTVQWGIDQQANANQLWQRYRGNNDDVVGNIGRNVVERELRRSLNVVFEAYNPLAVLTQAGAPTVSIDGLANEALGEMRAHVDPGIDIDTMRISLVHYDDITQGKLNAFAQALADTQIATQQKLTAEQQKEANDLLASAASSSQGVQYQNCLNLIKDLAARDQLKDLPPTFNCGGVSPNVLVGAK
jgi:regulator of protease activity HflC (stomatin/prohibitin superfamily)